MTKEEALKIMEGYAKEDLDRVMVAEQLTSHPNFQALGGKFEYVVAVGSTYSYGNSYEEAIENFEDEVKSSLDEKIAKLKALIEERDKL